MNLLGWTANFGPIPGSTPSSPSPGPTPTAASGSWVVPDRTTSASSSTAAASSWVATTRAAERARIALRTTTEAYRATGNRDIVPVALGFWAQAERRSGDLDKARYPRRRSGVAHRTGALPASLNESARFLGPARRRHRGGRRAAARDAIGRGMGPSRRRLRPHGHPLRQRLPHRSAAQRQAARPRGAIRAGPPDIARSSTVGELPERHGRLRDPRRRARPTKSSSSAVARHLDTVNLPDDRDAIREIIDLSQRSFTGEIKDPKKREYVFVSSTSRETARSSAPR